jgi:hypothetical protein
LPLAWLNDIVTIVTMILGSINQIIIVNGLNRMILVFGLAKRHRYENLPWPLIPDHISTNLNTIPIPSLLCKKIHPPTHGERDEKISSRERERGTKREVKKTNERKREEH